MTNGIVTSRRAYLRDGPDGERTIALAKGAAILVKAGPATWAEVVADAVKGLMSRRSFGVVAPSGKALSLAPKTSPAIPPEAAPSEIKVVKKSALGPGGVVFGKLHKLGLFNYGRTALDMYFDEDPDAFPDLSASLPRVMRAVAANEGKIEAINTRDNAILSCSIYQWTVSEETGADELPYTLSILKGRAPNAFDTYFGSLGLDVIISAPKPVAVGRGYFWQDGKKLATGARKAPLHGHLWAYRFWRSAHDPEVRRAYVRAAIDRIPVFYGPPVAVLGNWPLSDFVSSEEAASHLLDQHVNRLGHVPKTLVQAIGDIASKPGKKDPATWGDDEERAVAARYLALRHAPSMTDSADRAKRIADAVSAGRLSDQRGGFK